MASGGVEQPEAIEPKEIDPKLDSEELNNWMEENAKRPLVIALAGKSGVGKSTLLNNILGLRGEDAAKTGHDGNSTTKSVTRYNNVQVGKVTIEVIDTPGFDSLDCDENLILKDLEVKSKGKADLLLYCASLQSSGHIGYTDGRIVNTLTNAFGKQIWEHAILVLTFANEASQKENDDSYKMMIKNYAENFEECLKRASVGIKVISPDVSADESAESKEMRAIPAGLDITAPLPNANNWMDILYKEILQKCSLDALPQLLLLSGRVKVVSVIKSVAGGAAAGVVVGAGVGAGVGGALVGIPTLGVGAPIGVGVGAAVGALVGSVSSATIVSVIHNRVVPAIKKRVLLRHRQNNYSQLESKDSSLAYHDESPELPIEEEQWYFGKLKRSLAEGKCKEDGDYLVRYSENKGMYVLTCHWEGKGRHFPIHEIMNDTNPELPPKYHIGSKRFPNIKRLLNYYIETETSLSQKYQVKIAKPITRYGNIGISNIKVDKKIGKGAFGEVFEGRLISTNEKIAVKTCGSSELQEKDKFLKEAEILSKYNHPNVVRLIGLSEDVAKQQTYIVMEFMPGGSFLDFLRKEGSRNPQMLSKKKLCKMCIDACKGMEYLESMGCIHRDLAARNCLVGENDIVKISDFGMSREGGIYVFVSSSSRRLPIKWTAPEALKGQFTSASDAWSFGILLWEAFSFGSVPYAGIKNQQLYTQIDIGYRLEIPEDCPQEVFGIMEQCWQYQPEERPDFSQLLDMLTQAEANIIEDRGYTTT